MNKDDIFMLVVPMLTVLPILAITIIEFFNYKKCDLCLNKYRKSFVHNGICHHCEKERLLKNKIEDLERQNQSMSHKLASKEEIEVAKKVLRGEYGNQPERQRKLNAEGYNYGKIQGIVNAMMKENSDGSFSTSLKKDESGNWLNESEYEAKKAEEYEDIMEELRDGLQ